VFGCVDESKTPTAVLGEKEWRGYIGAFKADDNGVACWDGKPLVSVRGQCTLKTLRSIAIH
jgi:hypothetical protein